MPEYLHPGVYIEEIERGPRPIEGVPTSTAAFLGETERGPLWPRMVTSYKEYLNHFGGIFARDKYLPYAASGFFENGGKRLFVCRISGSAATAAEGSFGDFRIRASGPGSWGKRIWAKIEDGSTKDKNGNAIGFCLTLAYWQANQEPFDPSDKSKLPRPQLVEVFDDLETSETSPNYYGKRLPFIDLDKGNTNQGTDSSALGILVRNPGVAATARPANGSMVLSELGDDDTAPLTAADYDGLPSGARGDIQGLAALELDSFREISLVYAPNVANDVVLKIITHCENQRFRFAVVDSENSQPNPNSLDPRTKLPTDSHYAAYYYPWIVISDPATGSRKLVPPGGHALGVFARTDSERGVFKAPANEVLRGVVDLEYDVNDAQQGTLNPRGVNAIRRFPGRGIRIWGARTLTSNALWKYVSVRRLFIFLERSIYEGTQWVVFEPNDPRLWARVTDTIRLFLRAQWRLGALYGRTEDQAFFITCNETVMSQDDILNGRLICEIGIAPVRPAEFVIFRIFQNTAETQR